MAFAEQNNEALAHELFQIERELVQTRFQHSMSQLEDTSSIRTHRKAIARIKHELGNRESAAGLAKGSLLAKHRRSFRAEADDAAPAEKGGFLSGVVDKLAGKE